MGCEGKMWIVKVLSCSLGAAALVAAALPAWADSPLTSTSPEIALTYSSDELPELNEASLGVLTPELAARLTSDDLDMGSKVALVNALGWSIEGKDNASVFKEALASKYGDEILRPRGRLDVNLLSTDELVTLGYLLALDDYFAPWDAVGYLDYALIRAPESLAVQLIRGLVHAQMALSNDWCAVWRSVEGPVENPASYVPDLKLEAVDAVAAYMGAYKPYCQ